MKLIQGVPTSHGFRKSEIHSNQNMGPIGSKQLIYSHDPIIRPEPVISKLFENFLSIALIIVI